VRLVYGSDPFAYDFASALGAARRRVRERKQKATAELSAAERHYWQLVSDEKPTAEDLLRHTATRGLEGVAEIAAAYSVNLRVGKRPTIQPKRQRRTTTALRDEIVQLRQSGVLVAAIADELNISERRVRELLRDSEAA
jgi:hypothetical protein